MRIKPIILASVLAATGVFAMQAQAQQAGYRVIVHKDNPTTALSAKDISSYLLKRKSRWDHGVAVDPIDLDPESEVRKAFSREVHGRSVSSIKNYWQRQIFSGREVPPPEVASDAEVIAHVKANPGAIGYVSASARLDGVKVLDLASE